MKEKQIGGDHYKNLQIEPWEYAEANVGNRENFFKEYQDSIQNAY
jgi:hypothetical protein